MKRNSISLVAASMAATLWTAVLHAEPTDTINGGRINTVVVTGTRSASDVRHLPLTVTTVDRNTLTANERQNILPTLMEQVPGLMVTSRGVMGYGVSTGAAGGINVRGLSSGSGQVMVLIDGHPQYNGVYGHSIADSYQTLMTERVEVMRSPASMLYGSNAMGGVVNIVTRKMNTDGSHTTINAGGGSYGTVQVEAANQSRMGRLSTTAAAQYSRSDNHRPNMKFEQYGGYVKLNYDLSDHWNVYGDLDLTHFNASNPGTVAQPKLENKQWITRGAASLVLENHFDGTNGALSVYDNFGRHKINDGYDVGGTPQTDLFRSKDAVAGISWWQTVSLLEGNHTTIGADYQHIYGRAYYTDRQTNAIVTTPRRLMQSAHAHENEVAGYIDVRQDITDWLTIDAGIRYDHHSTAGGEWVPQGGFVVRPIANGELKGSISKGFRNPNTREMYLYGTANHETLQAESMVSYEVAWSHRIMDGRLHYGINLFIIDGKNLIQTVAGRNINSGEFNNRGVELEASYRINSNWSVNTNHSYLHMHTPLAAAPKYKGYFGGMFTSGAFNANVGVQQVCGLYTSNGANAEKETFTLLNATVGYRVSPLLRLWVKGDNLLAQKYEVNAGYPMPRATVMGGFQLEF